MKLSSISYGKHKNLTQIEYVKLINQIGSKTHQVTTYLKISIESSE